MMISSRGRYALRVLLDLAENDCEGFTPLKGIAERQGISHKYAEAIMTTLSKGGLVDGVHGKGGGYRLSRSAAEISVGAVLRLTEGSLAPVACVGHGAGSCGNPAHCRTYPMWEKLNNMIQEYLDSVSIADLLENDET